ncbi:dihydroceramide fatty acyl 2-hydroxylase FAH2 [Agrilus planipennis]|uniref:Fatty acid 2-hydroxylase n=1 Tax=Agrilus planipennis TaxID=224129 RepID=A0A7F5RKC8_AGRPL|nr:dihydroceramide fatty acyl 2-hydroxylase FAH2 [Agrilus planipennis]
MSEMKFKLNYKGNSYDLTDFLQNHPGGYNYLKSYKNKEVPEELLKNYHASNAAFYLMKEFSESKTRGLGKDQVEGVEDLEHLVDWSKPLLLQVGKLGSMYTTWVESPVDRPVRLFSNSFLESVTRTSWYSVVLVWVPIISFFFYTGFFSYHDANKGTSQWHVPLIILFGLCLWSIAEYSLHRWLFHLDPKTSPFLITLNFMIHGIHHKVPFDADRLLFPPLPAGIIGIAFYYLFTWLLPSHMVDLTFGGFCLGYLIYDMTHFYLHHGCPAAETFLYDLKRYHNKHHFDFKNDGFGVSSPYWDKVFGTLIYLKGLPKAINWTIPTEF